VATRRAWERERKAALEHAHEELLNEAARSPSLSKRFFRTFRTAPGARQQADGRTNPFLDPLPTAACWRGISQRHPDSDNVAAWDPIVPPEDMTIDITPAQVQLALKRMQRRAPGPDGLDFLVLQLYAAELAPSLAKGLTHAARHGLPEDSPLRSSETLLFYENTGYRQAAGPTQYRPITLLPMVRMRCRTPPTPPPPSSPCACPGRFNSPRLASRKDGTRPSQRPSSTL
jgi:hypothetical protein